MPTVSVNLDTDIYVQVNTAQNPLVLQAHRDSVRITLSNDRPVKNNTVFHMLEGGDAPLHLHSIDTNVWALATTERSSLVVTETEPYPLALHDASGNPIGSESGAINVHNAHVHSVPVNELFHLHTAVASTVAVASAKQDRTITLASVIGFSVGDDVQINNGVIESTFPRILSIAGDDLTFDRPMDFAHAIGATVEVVETNMAVDGSITPVAFRLLADPGQLWHIISFILTMTHPAAADDSKFGDIAALTNGCILRGYNAAADQYMTVTSWRTNGDIKLDMYDVPYTDKAGGGLFGVNANGGIHQRTGAVPKLDGTAGDYMELLIQDDLTALTTFKFKGQGHIEGM